MTVATTAANCGTASPAPSIDHPVASTFTNSPSSKHWTTGLNELFAPDHAAEPHEPSSTPRHTIQPTRLESTTPRRSIVDAQRQALPVPGRARRRGGPGHRHSMDQRCRNGRTIGSSRTRTPRHASSPHLSRGEEALAVVDQGRRYARASPNKLTRSDRAALYAALGVSATYDPATGALSSRGQSTWRKKRVGGGT